jgi:hypothetical protein
MRKSLRLTPVATILAAATLLAGALGNVAASPAEALSKSHTIQATPSDCSTWFGTTTRTSTSRSWPAPGRAPAR